MKFYDAFCGIGGFRLPMQELGWKCVGGCDIDKHTREVYKFRFSEYPSHMDIREIDPKTIPDHDCFCGGFPCPTFSIAGRRLGFKDPRGELFFEIARIVEQKRPKLLFLENVTGLFSHDGGKTFATILSVLDELRYDVEWQVLNSKYWVPQNRERVFIIGHLRGESSRQIFPLTDSGGFDAGASKKAQGKGSRVRSGYSRSIDAHYNKGGGSRTMIAEPTMNKIGNISDTDHDSIWGRVYDTDGISPTINAKGGGLGAKTGLIIDDEPKKKLIAWSQSTRETGKESRIKEGEANTLTAGDGCRNQSSGTFVVEDAVAVLSTTRNNRKQNGRRIKEEGDEMFTLTTQDRHGIYDGKRIRKLTPLECERLQGFPDNWTKIMITDKNGKIKEMSDEHRYACCGNAVTVPVIKAIAERIIIE